MLARLIFALLLPWLTPPAEKCSISGTVVSSVTGEPLNKVELRLEPVDRRVTHVAVTRSGAGGDFALADLDPGTYRLIGTRNGYLEMSYGARTPHGDGTLVRLETGQALNGITFKLTPSAVIAGTVRDSDGEPIENAHVTLGHVNYTFGGPRIEAYDNTDTDDRGEYRFRGLAAGKYYVEVDPKSQEWGQVDHSAKAGPAEIGVATLYPGVTDMALAAPIEVRAGKSVTGIDVTLVRSRVFHVTGKVVNASGAERLMVELRDAQNAGMTDYAMSTSTKDAAGNFEFRAVPPGSYEMTVTEALRWGKTSVVVGASDIAGVRVVLAPGAEIELRVTKEGSDKPVLTGLNFFFTANGRSGSILSLEADQSTIEVAPDHYAVKIEGTALRELYIKSARAGDADVLADGLTVTGGNIGVDVVLAADGGVVQGVVRDKDQQPVAGATILLAPDKRSRADLFRSTASDQNGRYELAAIAPGDYKLFAWGEVEPHEWNDPQFLKDYEKQGEKVELQSSARSTVDLHLAVRPDSQ